MKIQQFLEHHDINENPFGQEDAQTDHVFQDNCLNGTHHPAWDKIYGNPKTPSTSVVFGEKGSGKTALRFQIVEQLKQHNLEQTDSKVFVVEYDDFNPFLDCFRERFFGRKRRPERVLSQWRLWDHMDAILSLAVTRLCRIIRTSGSEHNHDELSISREEIKRLTRMQKRDLLLLSALYDHSYEQPPLTRWRQLRRKLKFSSWLSRWDCALGFLVTLLTVGLILKYGEPIQLREWWTKAICIASWAPWMFRQIKLMWTAYRVSNQIRVFDHQPNILRRLLSRFRRQEISGQPLPEKDRSEDRYELLSKLQGILKQLGFSGMVVLVDRVDEPHLVNGAPERMRDLLWPMFDNKFLNHPGIGFKLLLPEDVVFYINREEKAFYERSRLDKQNLIRSLEWTGESLYDVVNDRLRACSHLSGETPTIRNLFDDSITSEELVGIFARLRVPRHLFKFLYRLMMEHCNHHTDENPSWKISRATLQATLAVSLRDLGALEQGLLCV